MGNAHAQYELAIPMSSVGDCFTKVGAPFTLIQRTVAQQLRPGLPYQLGLMSSLHFLGGLTDAFTALNDDRPSLGQLSWVSAELLMRAALWCRSTSTSTLTR